MRGDEVFVSASYDTGAALFRLSDDRLVREWFEPDALNNHYTNTVRVGDYLYGYHGRQDIAPPAELRCIRWADGRVMWRAPPGDGVGWVIAAGDRLGVLLETGVLLVAEPSPEGVGPLARAAVLGFGLRAAPALSAGRLYARDGQKVVCVEMGPGP